MDLEQKGTGGSVLTLTGNRQAVVDGCDGIVDYDETQVIFRAGRLRVHIIGTQLQLKRLTDHSAIVEGYLASVEFGM